MPEVFLSPSSQEYNPYVNGGNEEYYMNLITDALIPYLDASGIGYRRNDPRGSFIDSVRLSNQDSYGLHLAIHSNASAPPNKGKAKGTEVYYYPQSSQGKRAAEIFSNNWKEIYPDPSLVRAVPTTTLGEVVKTKAPAILIETAFHDNPEDADWIRDNLDAIAENLAISIGDFFGVPISLPSSTRYGTVTTADSPLNLRSQPTVNSTIRAKIPNGTKLPLLSENNGWYQTVYDRKRGYVSAEYIRTGE